MYKYDKSSESIYRKKWKNILYMLKQYETVIYVILFSVLILFVYREYLFGNKLFVSTGDAMDMYDQFYPDLLNRAEYIQKGDYDTQMDFSIALGGEISFGIPTLYTLASYFGIENVAYVMGIVQILKIMLAGVFFYYYILEMGKKPYVAAFCSIAYAFCGHMAIRQFWLSYATEVTMLAIWLWAFERWFMKNDKKWLPLVTFFLIINLSSVYYVILYVLLISTYIAFRYIYEERLFKCKKEFSVVLFTAIGVSVCTYGITNILGQFSTSVSSDRFVKATENSLQFGTFWLNKDELLTLFSRTVGLNILGVGKKYSGLLDCLTAPTFYMGIFCLLLIIPIWLGMKGRKKVLISFVGVCVCVYIFVNPIRKLANGFSDENFKLSSFWIIVMAIFICAQGMDEILFDMKNYQLVAILIISGIIEFVGAYLICANDLGVEKENLILCMGIVFLFVVLSIFIYYTKKKCIVILCFVVAVFDATFQMNSVIKEMNMLDENILKEKVLYNDYTNEVLDYLGGENDYQDYRVDKQFFSYRYNDSWAQGYNGTSFYLGGIGAQKNVLDLYESLKLPTAGSGYKYAYGTSPYTQIDTLLGVKYILSQRSQIINYGFSKKYSEYDINAWENDNRLSIGYCYEDYILRNDYDELDTHSKRSAMLQACVIEDGIQSDLSRDMKKVELNKLDIDLVEFDDYEVEVNEENGSYDLSRYSLDKNTLVIVTDFLLEENVYRANLNCYTPYEVLNYKVRVDKDETQVYEINAVGIQNISFCYDDDITPLCANNPKFYIIPSDLYYDKYCKNVRKLQSSQLAIEQFSGKFISGKLSCENDSVLCLTIPYGNWNVYIDGEKVETFLTNIAFTGCKISKGSHLVEVKYSNFKVEKEKISRTAILLMCIIWIGIIVRREKMGEQNEKTNN